ncbi:MAG: hypothetical protein IJ282_09400, partial [Lachnospiraceae bacterium]|nr:hypothetical protein [Lachnospiraceae bacterium]
MRKRIMKFLALLLSVALVLGTVNYTSQNVQADDGGAAVSGNDVSGNNPTSGNNPGGEEEGSYTITMYASSLTKGWGQNATYELNDTNRLEVGFTASGGQQRVMLPASFDIDDCESMVVNIESQTAPFNLQTYNASTQLGVYYYNT